MKERIKKESGAIAVEFVIFFGAILIIFAISLELSRIIRYEEYATLITREASSISYRDCAQDTDSIEVRECLNLVAENVCNMANNLVDGSDLIISVFKIEGSAPTLMRSTFRCSPNSNETHSSRFSIAEYGISSLGAGFLQSQKMVVIAESFVPFRAYLPGLSGSFGFGSNTIYELSIL